MELIERTEHNSNKYSYFLNFELPKKTSFLGRSKVLIRKYALDKHTLETSGEDLKLHSKRVEKMNLNTRKDATNLFYNGF